MARLMTGHKVIKQTVKVVLRETSMYVLIFASLTPSGQGILCYRCLWGQMGYILPAENALLKTALETFIRPLLI